MAGLQCTLVARVGAGTFHRGNRHNADAIRPACRASAARRHTNNHPRSTRRARRTRRSASHGVPTVDSCQSRAHLHVTPPQRALHIARSAPLYVVPCPQGDAEEYRVPVAEAEHPDRQPDRVGLCADCRFAQRVESMRASVFYRCEHSDVDPSFPRYPRLPVLHCTAYVPRSFKPAP